MTERVLGPTGGSRRKRLALFVPFLALTALILAIAAAAGPIGLASGFEDDDGNLVDNAATGIDWNSFSPTTWSTNPPAPFRTTSKVGSGWSFKGVEDAQAVTSDTGFAGGTKQDDACPTVTTAKAPNKDDLKRIYIASKTGADGHTYLNLAWVRIPQQTTSSSAHIGFEFNQGTTACGAGHPLVQRTAGDMLIVYDFEGGSGDPVLTLRRWVTSGACEVGSKSPPCWGTAVNLTASGFAEAKVNVATAVSDAIAPSPPETLNDSEFGEAGIDLTAASVFPIGACASFGKAYAVSRSSGSSGTAQMKDLDGPVDFNLTNCGTVTVIKQTDPRGLNQAFTFTSNLAGAQMVCTADATPAAFTLNDTGNAGKTLGSNDAAQNSAGNTETCTSVPAGSYTVAEGADPAGFAFDSLTCTASGTGTSVTTSTKTASITLAGGGSVICRYENNQQLGAIKITKTSTKSDAALAGAKFSITSGGNPITGSPFETNSSGIVCVGNLGFGDYVVTETVAPDGFAIDDATGHTVTVGQNSACPNTNIPAAQTLAFTDTPLADIQVRFKDGGSGETALDAPLDCGSPAGGTPSTADTQDWDDTLTITGIKVDGVAVITVTCTIKIDP